MTDSPPQRAPLAAGQAQGFLVGDRLLARTIRRAGRPVRSLLRRCGLDVVPSQVWGVTDVRRDLVAALGVDLVDDAGANAGQYALALREQGYRGAIFSIEPTEEAFRLLSEAASADPLWTCVRCAVGDAAGTTTINVAGNSCSSSLLPMLPAHTDAVPKSRYVGEERVEVARLDELVASQFAESSRIFLKADVQGFEDRVLAGASGMMHTGSPAAMKPARLGTGVTMEKRIAMANVGSGQAAAIPTHLGQGRHPVDLGAGSKTRPPRRSAA
jgi:FkbM family methyltransferase